MADLLGGTPGGSAFEALRGVSLEVPRGKLVGILGRNGAGKSTLLRVLGGVSLPSAGTIRVSGNLGSLFELGGLGNRMITGRECADRVLRLLGADDAELPALIEEIKDFSELGNFFERRIYTYSAGMSARLYFSIATAQRHDVYLIDEVLSVGDEHFQAKCWRRLRERLLNGACGVLVTHDWSAVIKLCERSHVLERGSIALSGKSEAVIAGYLRIPPPKGAQAAFAALPSSVEVRSGEDLDWSFEVDVKQPATPVAFAFSVETVRPGFGWEILILSEYEPLAAEPGRYRLRLRIARLPLAAGEYSLNLFLQAGGVDAGPGEPADQRSWTIGNALKLVVTGEQEGTPVFRVPVSWRAGRAESAHVVH